MALVKESHTTENYYITMEIRFSNVEHYVVSVCPLIKGENGCCGYPIKTAIYSINEYDKAKRTFKRYTKTYI